MPMLTPSAEVDARADHRPLAVAVMGPTASGKTAFAADWAECLGTAIVSVDSALVYRRLDIGSAKPDAETLRRAPHRLIDIREPHEPYSAADFARDALIEMRDLAAQGKVPILAGGTGLYFKALLEGLSELPESHAPTRAQLQSELEERGLAVLHAELAKIDPEAGTRIHATDPQRTLRALEVFRLSGTPISVWQARGREQASAFPFRVLKLVLAPAQRSVLHERIELRFQQMLQQGFLDEVRQLRADPRIHADLPAIRAVGYRQAWQHLEGASSAEEFFQQGVAATRHLAKRQLTWLRSQHDARWFDPVVQRTALDQAMAGFLGPQMPV